MEEKQEEKRDMKGAWKILFKHLKNDMPTIRLIAVLGVLSAFANGAVPFIVGSFLDSLIDFSKTMTLGRVVISLWFALLVVWIVVQFFANVIDWIIDRKGRVLGLSVQNGYQFSGFKHLLYVPLSFHKDEKVGELVDKISKTSWQIASISEQILVSFAPSLLSVAVGIVVVSFINPLFTVVFLTGIAIYIVALIVLLRPSVQLFHDGHSAWTVMHGDAVQAVTNVQSVKHMATEDYEAELMRVNFMEKTFGIWERLEHMWSNVSFYQRMIILVTQATVFLMSVYFIQNGELTIGELIALNGYAGLLFGPFVILGYQWQTLQNGLVGLKQAEDLVFSTSREVYHPEKEFSPENIEGNVEFKDVTFAYSEGGTVLKNLTFEVKKGERVAFVGKTGVGKSTAIDLISGYIFPTQGEVLVDGHSTKEFDLLALRGGIAIVPQEPVLFNDTIMMNIRYGRLDATDEEVKESARKAHADEFIENLPDGYEQLVGERGVKLSVGQKQRVAIARAILRNPSILILDEPTSALDAETEKLIEESFEELMEGRTTFIIAHRLSMVRKADKIFVFENGSITETGTHSELLKKRGGVYKKLHNFQSGAKE